MQNRTTLLISEEVRAALDSGSPVVALETAVLTHGLPHPQNLEAAAACEHAVRQAGAIPAIVALLDGCVRVGLGGEQQERLALPESAAMKCAARDLGVAASRGLSGGTTVSATIAVAGMAGIGFLATGGIGGVHRGVEAGKRRSGRASAQAGDGDVSADLPQLTRSPVTVVCSGAKGFLDLPRTLESLETLGVPVLGYGTDEFPAFLARESGLRLAHRVDTPEEAARAVAASRALGYTGSVLIANPPPARAALERSTVEQAIEVAINRARAAQVRGPEVTPFLLAETARLMGGEALAANLALLEDNARVAAEIAVAYCRLHLSSH